MKAKQKRKSGSIDFITYEGLQVKYEQYELIIIPKEITDSKVGDSGEDYIQAFWKLGRSIEEVPNYHVKWKHHSKYIEIVYTNENDKNGVPFNKAMADFVAKKDYDITWGTERYFLKNGIVNQIVWYANCFNNECVKDNITYDSRNPKHRRKLEFKVNYKETRKFQTSKQVVRNQKEFRDNLLEKDKRCVISKVSVPEVLQAAHIVAVKEGGFEHVNNGVLLRADLHQLFDSGILTIDNKGVVHIDKERVKNAPEYMKYDGKRIDKSALKRIKEKLKEFNARQE